MERKLTCTNYFKILEKRYSREQTKNPNAHVQARPDVTFRAVGYLPPIPPPEFQPAFHIYNVKYEYTLTCKRISWNSWGGGELRFKNIFLFPICIIQKVIISAPK